MRNLTRTEWALCLVAALALCAGMYLWTLLLFAWAG